MSIAKSFGVAAAGMAVGGFTVSMVLGYSGSAALQSIANVMFLVSFVLAVALAVASGVAFVASRAR